MNSLRIFTAILFVPICMQIKNEHVAAEEISYRLVHFDMRQFGGPIANYAISIDHYLDRPHIEQLICQVLQEEKPPLFSMLSIEIYHNIDKPIPGGLPQFDAEWEDHIIAVYGWNIGLPNERYRLMIFKDAQGNYLKPSSFYNFDHTKVCKQDAGQIGK